MVEGWHGVPFGSPLALTRDVVTTCRAIWPRERVRPRRTAPSGDAYRPLKIMQRPPRPRIPIYLGAVGDRNVALAAEIADGWMPTFFWPERVADVWGEPLRVGRELRSAELGPLEVSVSAPLAIDDGLGEALAAHRAHLAHYIGGMGTKKTNFYHRLAGRYGFGDVADRIQDLYLSGRRDEAIALVPDDFAHETSLIGDGLTVGARVAAYEAAGVTVLNVVPHGSSLDRKLEQVTRLRRALRSEPGIDRGVRVRQ